jgi:membrane peptidoglycan carboxypeptidase
MSADSGEPIETTNEVWRTLPSAEEPGSDETLTPAAFPVTFADAIPSPAEQSRHTSDPLTPVPEPDVVEAAIELSPQMLRVLRYLERRHARDVRITRRLPLDESEPEEVEEQAVVDISLRPTQPLQNNGNELAGRPQGSPLHVTPLRTLIPDPVTPIPEPDVREVRYTPITDPLAGRPQGSPLHVTPLGTPLPGPITPIPEPGLRRRRAYAPHATMLVDARRKRRQRRMLLGHFSRKHLRMARANKRRARKRLWIMIASTVLALLMVFLSLGSAAGYIAYHFVNSTQSSFEPKVLTLHDLLPPDNLKMYDSKGVLIDQLTDNGIHTTVTYDQVAPIMREATVATEDKDFWHNPGIDVLGIIRAILTDLENGRILEGGSTITQQLIKNLIVGNQPTIVRKLEEIILAPQVNHDYSKSDILTMYLNSIYYGHQAYGVDAAATVYFGLQDQPGRSAASQLDLAQAAMLAGLPSNPSRYDPLAHPQAATGRFEAVLDLMVSQGYITNVEKYDALREQQAPNFFKTAAALRNRAPHFANFVLAQLQKVFNIKKRSDLSRSNMVVYTTLDIGLQDKIQKIMQQHIAALRGAHHLTNAAEVLIDFRTGAIISQLGSIDYNNASIDGQFDVTQAYRQPGSSFKPYVYVTAFEQGASPAQAIDDQPITIRVPDSNPPTFTPVNYDRSFHGHMTLRCALQNSLNVPGVKVLEHAGIDESMLTAYNMGITTYQGTPGYSLVLGGLGIRLIDHTSAMGVFANGGVRVPYYAVDKVVSGSSGKVLYQHQLDPGTQVISPQLAYMMTNVLSDNTDRIPEFGNCNVLQLYANSQGDCWNGNRGTVRPAAAKTGTTNDFRDNWTVGYTTDYVMGVWAGNDDNSPMIDVSGIDGAAPIWHDSMLMAEKGHPIQGFVNPGGLERATVTYADGVQSTDWFLPGTVPTSAEPPTTTTGDGDTPSPEPGAGNPSQTLPSPYCPASYSFGFAPPPDDVTPPDAGWW